MSVLNRDVKDIASDIGTSFHEFHVALSKEEIQPRHVEEVAMSIVAFLLIVWGIGTFAPSVLIAERSVTPAPLATALLAVEGAANTSMSNMGTHMPKPPMSNLTSEQVDAVLALLKSYNADEGTMKRVQMALGGKKPQANAAQFCREFLRNLRIGDKGEDVSALQKGLREAGFNISDSSTGTFDDATASAVTGFQEKYKGDILQPANLNHGNGFVGPATRAKLNILYRCHESAPRTNTTPDGTIPTQTNVDPSSSSTASPILEQVKCVFNGATTEQKCYSAASASSPAYFLCSGIGSCTVDVKGRTGVVLIWRSSCLGDARTVIDGQNEYANFRCGERPATTAPSATSDTNTTVNQSGTTN